MASQCLISFGSNLGDRHALIADAARAVAASEMVHELQVSRLFETPPIGGPSGQEPFLNAVAAFETFASARQVLDLLQRVETELGRQRRQRWDARAIDLDVVLHGELVGGGTGLIVPHPRYTARQFVLQPACDVAAHYRDPRFGWTLKRLTEHISQGVPSLALVGGDESIREDLCRRLEAKFKIQTFAAKPIPAPMQVLGNAPLPPDDSVANQRESGAGKIDGVGDAPWVSAFLPMLPPLDGEQTGRANVPRLVVRMQSATAENRWPAPHQMWPAGWRWPEYRLEIDDLEWAVSEIASAISSMRCPVEPVTEDGRWW